MRVGFLSLHSPHDPGALSGLPHETWSALNRAGLDMVDLSGFDGSRGTPSSHQSEPSALRRAVRRARRLHRQAGMVLMRPWEYGHTLAEVRARTAKSQALLDGAQGLDLLFGAGIGSVFFEIETDLPIVYASDTTARLMNTTYPEYRARSAGYHRACDEIERSVLHRCAFFAPASACTAKSAIEDYGLPPGRVEVVELGANVTPDGIAIDPDPPTRDRLELVLVAADPKRKRLDLCIEVTQELRKRGWNATLKFVGGHDPVLDGVGCVEWAGRLELSDPGDRQRHMEILQRSHWMLLPSVAEAYGIAPCEAAHFGRPSVVTDVGGLPTVVRHGQTGVVVPVDAPASAYADAIEQNSTDAARYADMSQAALQRARTTLSWSVWAEKMRALFERAVAGAGTAVP